MNAYLAEVVKKQESKARSEEKRSIASNLLEIGKMTIEEIARCSGLALAEVKRLAYMHGSNGT